jgi:hypothetical protein
MLKRMEYFRPDCPACGMAMIVADGFGRASEEQTWECLRCGHVDSATAQPDDLPLEERDARNAQRYRDKAAEADQLSELAQTQSRREALAKISNNYLRTAQQLEALANIKK